MARFGEGDPRWIVADRPDGQNVNAWHWSEKDVSEYAKKRLAELLQESSVLKEETVSLRTTTSKVEGECNVFNRKGKMSFLMELDVEVQWEAEEFDSTGKSINSCKGKFTNSEVDHDVVPEKADFTFKVTDGRNPKLQDIAQRSGIAFVRAKLGEFLKELKDGYGLTEKGKVKDTNGSPAHAAAPPAPPAPAGTTEITQTLEWNVALQEIWDALVQPQRVSAYTRGPAKIEPVVGGAYEVLNGAIVGTFTEITPFTKLAMSWRLKDWAAGVSTDVQLTLTPRDGATTMKLQHKNVPFAQVERVQEGWYQNFWEPIKMLFGYGFTRK